MTNLEQFRQDLEDWINNFVSIPHPLIGNLPPCPYAKPAWFKNRVGLRWFQGSELPQLLMEQIKTWNDDLELVLFGCDPQALPAHTIHKYAMDANQALVEYDLVALAAHPDKPSITNGVVMAHDKYAWVGVQRLSKLEEASEELFKLGYYQCWSEEGLAKVVNWRRELLQKVAFNQNKEKS